MSSVKKVLNFSAGPSKVPEAVLKKAQEELIHFGDVGISVMEMSHRSKFFENIIETAEKDLRELVGIPDNYKVLFLQGGGTGMFAAVPLNLATPESTVDCLVTGTWSSKAADEAEKYCNVNRVTKKLSKHTTIPDRSEWSLSPNAAYFHYCDNETIHGIEFPNVPSGIPDNVPIVADMSSNILTRPIDVTKFGCIYAGAQKNVGIGGLAIVIIREDLIGKQMKICPNVFNFKLMADNRSLYNTPNVFAIYITGLCLKWIKENGGIEQMQKNSAIKSNLIYDLIDKSNGFYSSVIDKKCQSRVNVPFRICNGNDELEKKFLDESIKRGMLQLKGHRSVGGLRASLFNAITIEETQALIDFMKEFQGQNQA